MPRVSRGPVTHSLRMAVRMPATALIERALILGYGGATNNGMVERMERILAGQSALVTGSTSGIGRGIAKIRTGARMMPRGFGGWFAS